MEVGWGAGVVLAVALYLSAQWGTRRAAPDEPRAMVGVVTLIVVAMAVVWLIVEVAK
jgi:hypothetical protein